MTRLPNRPKKQLSFPAKKALAHFAGGPAEVPSGVGTKTIGDLVASGLIQRTQSPTDFGPQFYDLTEKGRMLFLSLKTSN